jgi:DNA replication initiation complex subunit (GINS family)
MMKIDFDELRRIHRLEKNTSKLVEVDEDFIDMLASFVDEEKKMYIESLQNFSANEARSFTNLKRIVEEIFLFREKKILNKALIASHTKDSSIENMATQEKEFYKKLLPLLESYSSCCTVLFGGKETKKTLVEVEILKDIPTFVGTDMKEYGPFKKGDVVEVPAKVSKLFIARKIAQEK